MANHKHTVKTESKPYGYRGGVATRATGQEPRAAGGICVRQECACGAYREVNKNNGYAERGPWYAA